MMNFILPCVQGIFYSVFDSKVKQKQVISKRYSQIDNTPPSDPGDKTDIPQSFQQTMPTSYTNQLHTNILIIPNIDTQTTSQIHPGNLLISNCHQSSIIIMRSLQNVYVDSCSKCSIFIGPCYSTFFIRNCRDCKVRTISQQLRIENSENIVVEGIVGVRPVLEGCKDIEFYSLGCKIYEDLIWQIEKTKIDIFDNQIYQCYDFTPKKYPNFSNGQKINNIEIDNEWEVQISLNDLDWGLKNAYLPRVTSVKKSMIGKVYTESQIKNNFGFVVLFAKMSFKEFICALNYAELSQKYTIIQKLSPKSSLKLLKSASNYRQLVKRTEKRQGNWYFLLVKTIQKINKCKVSINVIDERDLVWKLFHLENKSK